MYISKVTGLLVLITGISVCLITACGNKIRHQKDQSSFKKDSLMIRSMYDAYSEATSTNYDSSRILLQNLFDSTNRLPTENKILTVYFLSNIGTYEAIAGNLDIADSLSSIAIHRAYTFNDVKYYDVAHQNRGIYFWFIGKTDSAKTHFNSAIKWAMETEDIDQLIAGKSNLASLLQYQETPEQTISQLKEVIDLSKKHEKWRYMANAYNNIGNTYQKAGQLFTALKYYQESTELYEKDGTKKNYLNPLNNIAIIYMDLGMDSLAMQQYDKLRKLAVKCNNYVIYGTANVNMATIYYEAEEFEKAEELVDDVLNYYDSNNYPVNNPYVAAHINKGMYEKQKGNIDSAEYFLQRALNLAEEIRINDQYVAAGNHLTELYYDNNLITKFSENATSFLDTAIKYDFVDYALNLSRMLAKTSRKKNQTSRAFDYYDSYEKYVTAYLDTLSTQKIKDLAYFNELQRKENQKKLLEKENQLKEMQMQADKVRIKHQRIFIILVIAITLLLIAVIIAIKIELRRRVKLNGLLRDENDFKTNLFSIISHDLRSPISSVYNALLLIKLKKVTPKKEQQIVSEVLNRAEKTIDLIDNLLLWTRGQVKGKEAKSESFSACQLVNEIINHELENRKLKELNFENNLPETLEIVTDKNVVHMLFRNLLSNSYKFTPAGGSIAVDFKTNKSEYIFSVRDSGKGISPEDFDKILDDSEIITIQGLHGEQGKGLGLMLCKYFLQKCGGRIWFESKVNNGSTFFFSVPKFIN